MPWLNTPVAVNGTTPNVTVPEWASLAILGNFRYGNEPGTRATLGGVAHTGRYRSTEAQDANEYWRSEFFLFADPATGTQPLRKYTNAAPNNTLDSMVNDPFFVIGGVDRVNPVRSVARPPNGNGNWYYATDTVVTTPALTCVPGDLLLWILYPENASEGASTGADLILNTTGNYQIYARIATGTSETFDITVRANQATGGVGWALRPAEPRRILTATNANVGASTTVFDTTIPAGEQIVGFVFAGYEDGTVGSLACSQPGTTVTLLAETTQFRNERLWRIDGLVPGAVTITRAAGGVLSAGAVLVVYADVDPVTPHGPVVAGGWGSTIDRLVPTTTPPNSVVVALGFNPSDDAPTPPLERPAVLAAKSAAIPYGGRVAFGESPRTGTTTPIAYGDSAFAGAGFAFAVHRFVGQTQVLVPDATVANTNWTANTTTAHGDTGDGSDTTFIAATADGASVTLGLSNPSPLFALLTGAVLTIRARIAP